VAADLAAAREVRGIGRDVVAKETPRLPRRRPCIRYRDRDALGGQFGLSGGLA